MAGCSISGAHSENVAHVSSVIDDDGEMDGIGISGSTM
jgi:hypothetical protein